MSCSGGGASGGWRGRGARVEEQVDWCCDYLDCSIFAHTVDMKVSLTLDSGVSCDHSCTAYGVKVKCVRVG